MKIIGLLMIIAVFVAMFGAVAKEEGIWVSLGLAGATAFLVFWIAFACYLISH